MRESVKGSCGCTGEAVAVPASRSETTRQIVVPEDAYADVPMPGMPPVQARNGRTGVPCPDSKSTGKRGSVWYLGSPGMPLPGC